MYLMLHRMKLNWPCLSFDILRDPLGEHRSKYPHTMYMVTGSQAEGGNNSVYLLKISDLYKTQGDDDLDNDDPDAVEDDPILETKMWRHPGAVNRIRVTVIISLLNP